LLGQVIVRVLVDVVWMPLVLRIKLGFAREIFGGEGHRRRTAESFPLLDLHLRGLRKGVLPSAIKNIILDTMSIWVRGVEQCQPGCDGGRRRKRRGKLSYSTRSQLIGIDLLDILCSKRHRMLNIA